MGGRDIVVIGASTGGIDALQALTTPLPQDLPAAIFIVQHRADTRSPFGSDGLSEGLPDPVQHLIARRAKLPTSTATDGEHFQKGHIYVAPPGRHLLLERGVTRLETGPKEVWARPSVDVLFRSAALAYGRRVVGVVLSGALHDGTVGLWQIKKYGGVAIAQDPRETKNPAMVLSARESVPLDYCLPVAEITQMIIGLAHESPAPPSIGGPQTARILIVEDERIVALNLEKRLRELGYEIAGVASSGDAAIEMTGVTLPDLVLMDIRLEGAIEGTEAARHIWNQFQIPVVYATAYADSATLERVKATEAYGYIVKPFRSKDIQVTVQLALDRRSKELFQH